MPQLDWTNLISLTYDEIQKATTSPGVYRLAYAPGDGNRYVFYVGSAENLSKRLLDHIGNTEENECIKNYIRKYPCYFRLAIITDMQTRKGAEHQLFLKFKPKCNLREPDGSLVEINFD